MKKLKDLDRQINGNVKERYGNLVKGIEVFAILFGNIASIIFAFEFFRESLPKSIQASAGILFLCISFELLKRYIFRQANLEIVGRNLKEEFGDLKFKPKMDIKISSFGFLVLVFLLASMYMSISGLSKTIDNTEQAETQIKERVGALKDSLTIKYSPELKELRKQKISTLKAYNSKLSNIEKLESKENLGWKDNKRLESMKPDLDALEKRGVEIDTMIQRIEAKLDVSGFEKELRDKVKNDKADADRSVLIFSVIGVLIELLIYVSILIRAIFDVRYVWEYKNTKEYKRYLINKAIILEVLEYNKGNKFIPKAVELSTEHEVRDVLKLFNWMKRLNIIKKDDRGRFTLNSSKKVVFELLDKYHTEI